MGITGQLQAALPFGGQGCQVTVTGTAPCTFQGVTSKAPFPVGAYLLPGRVAFS